MDRWACVNVFALPLQLLLGRCPEWKDLPVAVVAELAPQSLLLEVNQRAEKSGVRVGMRYSEALSLVPDLRADDVGAEEIRELIGEIAGCLLLFSPGVEPFAQVPGVFWLNASGLQSLYPSLSDWAAEIKSALEGKLELYASVVVGFTRFGTLAVARTHRKTGVFASREQEMRAAHDVPLESFTRGWKNVGISAQTFEQLGIRTLADFLEIPAASLRRRFGKAALELYELAQNLRTEEPLKPFVVVRPSEQTRVLDGAEHNTTRLLFLVKQLVHPLCVTLDARDEKIVELILKFVLDHGPTQEESVRPAEPTLDERVLIELVRLRLENMVLVAGVVELGVVAHGTRTVVEQLNLFIGQGFVAAGDARDLKSANRALARLRAEFGEEAVAYVRLRDAHLPEAQVEWAEFHELQAAKPRAGGEKRMMRRLYLKPEPLQISQVHGLCDSGLDLEMRGGPHVVSGGWWVREVARAYYFAETLDGALLWVFFDEKRKRWFTQAELR